MIPANPPRVELVMLLVAAVTAALLGALFVGSYALDCSEREEMWGTPTCVQEVAP